MRDIILLAAFFLLLLPAFKKPFIAVSLWLWTAMFFPTGWVYGIAQTIRYNLIFSLLTIGGVFFVKNRPKAEFNALTILITLFALWVTITYMNGIGIPEMAREEWVRFMKVIALYYCACIILNKKHHIDFFVWCVVLSVGFFSSMEGLKLIASGGAHHIHGLTGHILDDRNDLALAIDMSIPLTIYLRGQNKIKLIRFGLLVVIILMVLCVLGTYSRGGLVGLLILGVTFLKEYNNKIFAFLVFIFVGYIGSILMPSEWFERMDTIHNADQDASFMSRVIAWKVSTLLALDHPIFGGGIKAIENNAVWVGYALQLDDRLTFIYTPAANLNYARAAHSLYFQVLGDQGFVGLLLFLLIQIVAYRKLIYCVKSCEPLTAYYVLAKMLKLSMIMYLVVGIALSKAYFDLAYAIYALVRVLERRVATKSL